MLGTLWHDVLAGVIWRGDSVIDGVPETLDMLRGMVRFQSLSLANKCLTCLHELRYLGVCYLLAIAECKGWRCPSTRAFTCA